MIYFEMVALSNLFADLLKRINVQSGGPFRHLLKVNHSNLLWIANTSFVRPSEQPTPINFIYRASDLLALP
jgi:hypothetical protein